jgi:hypothetical protein
MRSIGGEGYGLTAEFNHKLDILIEKLFAPLVGAPTKTETMDDDTTYDASYYGRLEEDDDNIITVKEDKAMQEMFGDAKITTKTQ